MKARAPTWTAKQAKPVTPIEPIPAVPAEPSLGPLLPNDVLPVREHPGSPDIMSLGPAAYLVSTHAIGTEMGLTLPEALVFINGLNARLLKLEPTWEHPAIPIVHLGNRTVVDHLALVKGWCRVFNPNMSDAERLSLAKVMVTTTNENIRLNLYRIAKAMYPVMIDRIRRVSRQNCRRYASVDEMKPPRADNLRGLKTKQITDFYSAEALDGVNRVQYPTD